MAIKIAKAMGHQVVAISSSHAKKELSMKKGADNFIHLTDIKANRGIDCDYLLDTIPVYHDPIQYLPLLGRRGRYVILGRWENKTINLSKKLVYSQSFGGSFLSGIKGTQECVNFCV